MTSLPLTRYEAAHLLDDYRLTVWGGATLDAQGLQHVLTGAPWEGCDVRPDGVTEPWAIRALDLHEDRWHRPPTPHELYLALDDVNSDPAVIAGTIGNMRAMLANAIDRRDQDHERLRQQAEARRAEFDRRTPDHWCTVTGVTVLDPAGWRQNVDGFHHHTWADPITRTEFDARCALSECQLPEIAPPPTAATRDPDHLRSAS